MPQNGTDCRLIHTGLDQRSGDWWAAWVEELPGANTQGTTIEEARENLREAIALMLEDEAEDEADSAPAVVGAEVLREVVTVTPA